MATFRPNPASPIPNNPFSAPLNPYVVGPWWPMPVGTGLGVDLIPGVLYSTGGGGGGIGIVTGGFPIQVTTSGLNVYVSIAPSTISNSGAVQLTNSLSNTSQTLALTAAAGKSLQDQLNALVQGSSAGLTLVGTINGSTGIIATVVSTSYPSFVVGSPLPAAAPGNRGTFLIITTPGTMTPPNGVATVTEEGDWWYSDGINWTLIPIGNPPPPPATPSALGTVFGCTPDSYAPGPPFPVVALGRSNVNPYTQGPCYPNGGHVLLGFDTELDYNGVCGNYGSVLVGNDTCTKDNAIAIGGCTRIEVGGGIAIGNSACIFPFPFIECCGGVAIGGQLDIQSGTVAIVTHRCACLQPFCNIDNATSHYGSKGVIIGSINKYPPAESVICALPQHIIQIGSQYGNHSIPDATIGIGLCALYGATINCGACTVTGQFGAPLAIGREALSGIQIQTSCLNTCPNNGWWNTAIGQGAGQVIGIGCSNTFVGALASAISGGSTNCSVAIGAFAAAGCNRPDTVTVGAYAAREGLGVHSIVIGSNAGNSGSVRTGQGNILIGSYVNSNMGSCQNYNLVVGSGFCFNPPNLNGSCQLALGLNSTGGATTSCYWLTGCPNMNIRPGAGIIDKNGSAGTNGQVLASTGADSVEWSSGNSLPAGALMNFVQSTAPSGWLVANGDTVPNGTGTVQGVTTDFSALYAALGSSFGGPGKLPDMRGMFTRGWDSAGGAARNCDPGRALGSQQGFALQNITGSICGIAETFGNTASPSSPTAGNALYRSASGPSCGLTPTTTDASNAGTMCFNASLSACTAAETRPVNIAILPCIKY